MNGPNQKRYERFFFWAASVSLLIQMEYNPGCLQRAWALVSNNTVEKDIDDHNKSSFVCVVLAIFVAGVALTVQAQTCASDICKLNGNPGS